MNWSLPIADQAGDIFYKNVWMTSDITKNSPQIEKKSKVRQLSSHFKPLAARWAPKAPNSVFDLPNFMHPRAA